MDSRLSSRTPLSMALAASALLALAGCGEEPAPAPEPDAVSIPHDHAMHAAPDLLHKKKNPDAPDYTELNNTVFDNLVATGPVANTADIERCEWAKAIRDEGIFKVGAVRNSFMFSQLDEKDQRLRGFDAGIYQLLARYILGDHDKYRLIQVTSGTREAVLQNNQVHAVVATYSITPARKLEVSFAGPYFTVRQGILVRADNKNIGSLADLTGRPTATQAGSTGPAVLHHYAPAASIELFANDTEARTALKQKRVDAYVTDYTLLLNAVVRNPLDFKIVGGEFGTEDHYGIGVPLESDAVPFLNNFLRKIIKAGLWDNLWQVTIGDRIGSFDPPDPPVIQD